MITVGTNIYSQLSSAHRVDIETTASRIFTDQEVTLNEYLEKDVNKPEQIKFFIGNLALKSILNDVDLWSLFSGFLQKIYRYSLEDVPEIRELQFWFTSTTEPLSVNIFFSAKKEEDIDNRLLTLRDTLTVSDIFSQDKIPVGKVLIVGYDNENEVWRLSYI